MDILEFVGGLNALPAQASHFARNKIDLAKKFGLDQIPAVVPYDVNQTYISDRAMDGYMASEILSDSAIAGEKFSDYAFTATAIFAAQQLAVRSGAATRSLNIEFPRFIFRDFEPCLLRIIKSLNYVPLVLDWWPSPSGEGMPEEVIRKYLNLFAERGQKKPIPIEQQIRLFSCLKGEAKIEKRFTLGEAVLPKPDGKTGLLVLYKLKDIDSYLMALKSLLSTYSEQLTVIIYDEFFIANRCLGDLISKYAWRASIIKRLTYQYTFEKEDFGLVVLQNSFFPNP